MNEAVLHQWEVSPFCGKVRKILRLKGIPFRVENYNGLRARQVAKLSAHGKLPVLDWEGERVPDSSAIALFLDQRQPDPPLYPADPREAALARSLEDWADESLYYYALYSRVEYASARARSIALLCEGRPAWERWLFAPVYVRTQGRKLDAHGFSGRSRDEIEATFLRHVDDLETMLRSRDWLVGSAQSIADIALSAVLDEMLRTSTLAERIRARPNVARWLARQAG